MRGFKRSYFKDKDNNDRNKKNNYSKDAYKDNENSCRKNKFSNSENSYSKDPYKG